MIKKMISRKKKPTEKLPTRITNDTVAQHREKVLAGGRKLKYPLQYTRSRLVRNTIIISISVLVALMVLVWAQLYVWKDTSDLAHRITRAIPLPIATIDGEYVRYSDYLLYHRSTIAVLKSQGRPDVDTASDRMRFQKQQALDRALEDAYAAKIGRERNITITDQQVNDSIAQQKGSSLSDGAYESAVMEHLGWTMDEMRQAMKNSLLRQEVALTVDANAAEIAQLVGAQVSKGVSIADIAKELGNKVEYAADVVVPKDNSDGGLSIAAAKLEVGKTSGSVKVLDGDGYYFITRQASGADTIGYSYIKVPLTEFKKQFNALKNSDKTKLFIKLD